MFWPCILCALLFFTGYSSACCWSVEWPVGLRWPPPRSPWTATISATSMSSILPCSRGSSAGPWPRTRRLPSARPAAPLAIPGPMPALPCRYPNGPPVRPRYTAVLPEILWRWPASARHPGCWRRPPVGWIKRNGKHIQRRVWKNILFNGVRCGWCPRLEGVIMQRSITNYETEYGKMHNKSFQRTLNIFLTKIIQETTFHVSRTYNNNYYLAMRFDCGIDSNKLVLHKGIKKTYELSFAKILQKSELIRCLIGHCFYNHRNKDLDGLLSPYRHNNIVYNNMHFGLLDFPIHYRWSKTPKTCSLNISVSWDISHLPLTPTST